MITERFVVPMNYKDTRRSNRFTAERFIIVCCCVICVVFLYNDRYIHDLLTKNERLAKIYRREESPDALSSPFRQAEFLMAFDGKSTSKHPQCQPRNNILFLKTHRTGSSTITNIINRYGDLRNLTFVLPKRGEYRLGWPYLFNSKSYAPLQGQTPNILCNHARYNREELDRLMPTDVTYVTIIRDPADQFLSVFETFNLGEILRINSTDSLNAFLSDPWFYLERALSNEKIEAIEFHRLQLVRNGVMFDLGFAPMDYENTQSIHSYIERLDKEFDLVMLTEYFVESLVLLKNIMCWNLNDVLYFVLNARTYSSQRHSGAESIKTKIQEWNHADYLLYKHFNKSFWQKVNSYGREFYEDVDILQNKVRVWENICSKAKMLTKHDPKFLDRSLENTLRMCRKLIKNESSYIEYLQQRQNVF